MTGYRQYPDDRSVGCVVEPCHPCFRPTAGDVREGDNRQFGLSLFQTQCRCGWCENEPAHEGRGGGYNGREQDGEQEAVRVDSG